MSNVVSINGYEMGTRYIPFPDKFEVGQRIHCIINGGKDGTIVAVLGRQSPETVRHIPGVGMVTGGSATIDVAWDTRGESGGLSRKVPESIARGVQWKMLSGYKDPKTALAESEAYIEAQEAKKAASRVAFEKAKEDVKKEYPFLTVDDGSDRNIVQKNLRILLSKTFPGVRFKVTKDGYSARNVYWTDGPTISDVQAICRKFEAGRFNGMEDIYEYNSTPFNSLFGDVQYILEHRDYSDEFIQKAIDSVWEKYGHRFEGEEKPTIEMYRNGGLGRIRSCCESFSDMLYKQLREMKG